MKKQIYLTIDDAPSARFKDVLNYLEEHTISAVFYCRGEFIPSREGGLVEAVKKGHLLGNHSYTHPFFSEISFGSCVEEIEKTEILLEEIYASAGMGRAQKIIRLPFGDRGEKKSKEHAEKIKNYLKEKRFERLPFQDLLDGEIDAAWTWDTKDYKTHYQNNIDAYAQNLEKYWQISSHETEVLLLHDFEKSYPLFEKTLAFLKEKNAVFLDPLK